MKKTVLCGLCLWLMSVCEVSAANTLSVTNGNVTIPKGGQATLEIQCSFDTQFVGFQFDLNLNDDISPIMLDGKPVATLGFTGTDHSLNNSQVKVNEVPTPNYRFIGTSMSQAELPTSGTVLSIVLNDNGSEDVGHVYNVKLKDITFGTSSSNPDPNLEIEELAFTITIGDALPQVTLRETDESAPSASSGKVDVTVNRTINANEWSTICLPFDMSEVQVKEAFGSDVELKDFTGWSFEGTAPSVDKITINFSDATEIAKNHPYIIKVSSAVSSFQVKNVIIDPATYPQTSRTFQVQSGKITTNYTGYMFGYYKQGNMDQHELFLSDNKFWYNNGSTQIKAFRATFYFTDSSNNLIYISSYDPASRIVMSFDEESTTGIRDNKRVTNSGKVYNLSGQQVEKPSKGLYIQDGKKVIIK